MKSVLKIYLSKPNYFTILRSCSTATSSSSAPVSCKLLIVGGGAAGCSMASKFTKSLGKDQVCIVEPSDIHYYQPMFTLVGGGMKKLKATHRPMNSVLPSDARWVKDKVVSFDPDNNRAVTAQGVNIEYQYLIVATGIELKLNRIKGLLEALNNDESGVSTNYSPKYVEKTIKNLKRIKEGNAVFTFPPTPLKCGGAPVKAILISDEYLKKTNKRKNTNFIYCTPQKVVFSAPFYAQKILGFLKEREVNVRFDRNLIEIDMNKREAIFENKENDEIKIERVPYAMLHVVPPMGTSDEIGKSKLVDQAGYVDVNKETLQHNKYKNIYSIGDCSSLPTSKTAAAIASQCKILYENLSNQMKSNSIQKYYNGYTSCPLVTGYSKCMLAEFDYTLKPLETFPIDQGKERKLMFIMKKYFMPFLYWNFMLKGYWNGPGIFREIFHLGGIVKQKNRE